jgi:hypothetical protein
MVNKIDRIEIITTGSGTNEAVAAVVAEEVEAEEEDSMDGGGEGGPYHGKFPQENFNLSTAVLLLMLLLLLPPSI